ncbi:MAG TPA: pseudouridine synthase [Candidatus Saccharimonadales bacterium]
MRINRFVAHATGLGRRKSDRLIVDKQITINGLPANLGQQVTSNDTVKYGSKVIELPQNHTTILLNKPVGYVCSRDGQGSRTIYDLMPSEYKQLKSVGRLDKDSSGLILLTDDGLLAQKLSHPSSNKEKIYEVKLRRELTTDEIHQLQSGQIRLDKKPSVLKIKNLKSNLYQVTILEGRNRQIRRTFDKLDISVISLNRIQFGQYKLQDLKNKSWTIVN